MGGDWSFPVSSHRLGHWDLRAALRRQRSGGRADRLDGAQCAGFLLGDEGADTFVFKAGYGDDVIRDFETGSDLVEVTGFGFVDVQALLDARTQDSADALLDTTTGDSLRLTGIIKDDLTRRDFNIA